MSAGQFIPGYIHVILLKSPTSSLLAASLVVPRPIPYPPSDARPLLRLATSEFTTLLGRLGPTSSEPLRWPRLG